MILKNIGIVADIVIGISPSNIFPLMFLHGRFRQNYQATFGCTTSIFVLIFDFNFVSVVYS